MQEALQLEGWERPDELEKTLELHPEEASGGTPPNKKQKVSTQSACVMRMQEYTGGQLTDALAEIRERGIDIGSIVTFGGVLFTVSSAEGNQVTVEHDAGEDKVSTPFPVSEFLEKFEIAQTSSRAEVSPRLAQKLLGAEGVRRASDEASDHAFAAHRIRFGGVGFGQRDGV